MKTRTRIAVRGATLAAGVLARRQAARRAAAGPDLTIDVTGMMERVQELHNAHVELRAAHEVWLTNRILDPDARHAGDELLNTAIERVLKAVPS
jgi:hypothetical protein